MPRASTPAQMPLPSLEASLFRITVESLKWYAAALPHTTLPTHKGELAELLRHALTDQAELRRLVEQLTPQQQLVVAEVVHRLGGQFAADRLAAKYPGSAAPNSARSSFYFYSSAQNKARATAYDLLFFYDYDIGTYIPSELVAALRAILPPPPAAELKSASEPPRIPKPRKGQAAPPELLVSQSEPAIFHDLSATLYLIQQGKAVISPATRLPALPTIRQLRQNLLVGEYFADQEYERAEDAVRPLALIVLAQAAKWAAPTTAGNKLELTKAGQALIGASIGADQIREAWERWLKSDLLDELSRVRNIKGQQAKGTRLTKPADRRAKLAAVLRAFPLDRWVAMDELLRYMRAEDQLPAVERGSPSLAVGTYNSYYEDGEGYGGGKYWDVVIGSYLRATLWEYVATLGLVEIAYTRPEDSPHDFGRLYYLDGPYLSRYDGLLAMRLTNLGAYVLGLAATYTPPDPIVEAGAPVLRVLPNLDLVITDAANFAPNDRVLIERIATPESQDVYRLSRELLLEATGSGLDLQQIVQFLAARSGQPPEEFPQIVRVFFDDFEKRLGALRETGPWLAIEADDPFLLTELANNPGLRAQVRLGTLGEKQVLFVPDDQAAALRRQLKKLGYLPKKG